MALYNLAGFKTATLGTADVVFSAPVTALNTFPLAGVPNGSTVTYMLENFDVGGNVDAREVGRGVWNSGTLTLARTTVLDTTNGGAKIVLGGNAEARITAIAQDFSASAVGAPALVSPSVVGNFVSFSNVTGSQADSGFSGTSFQPVDATLTSIAALGTAADKMIYTTALDTWAEADLSPFARTILDDANAAAVRTTIGAQAALGYTPVDIASVNYVDLTDGGATTLHTHAGGGVSGSGVVGQLAEWVTNTTTLQAAKLIGPASNILTITNAAASTLALNITSAKTLTLTAADNYTVTIPASLTVAGLAIANQFIAAQTIQVDAQNDFTLGAHGTGVFARFVVQHSRNTQASPTATAGFDTIGGFIFQGFGTTYRNSVLIEVANPDAAAHSASNAAGELKFTITQSASTTQTQVLRLLGNGVIFNENSVDGLNFRMESNNDANQFYLGGSGDFVTIGSTTELAKFGVDGNADEKQFVIQGHSTQTNDLQQWQKSDGTVYLRVQGDGDLEFDDGVNIISDTTTGTKIGTATTQKLGFWNVTPVIQPAAANQAALTNSTTGTYDGTLVDVGIAFSQSAINNNFTDIYTLLTEIRTALVNSGLIKGAA